MASDTSRPRPDDLQSAINAALARKRAEPQGPAGERLEPRFDDEAARRSRHDSDEIGPVPMGEEGPTPEIPPMPQYFEPDRVVQPDETIRREAGPRTKKRSLVWFFGPVIGVPIVMIVALIYYLGVEMQGEGVQDSAPLIAAPEAPVKVKPTEEGGMAVPDQDKLIYSEISPTDGEPQPEQLLPGPEEPQMPAATGEAETADAATATDTLTPPPAPSVEVPTVSSTEAAATETTGAEAAPAVEPSAAPVVEPAATPEPAPTAPATTATETASLPAGGFRIQLAALKSEEAAHAAWGKLQGKYPDLLGDLTPAIVKADLGATGIFYRVQCGPFDGRAAAQELCGRLSQRGQQCLVVQP